MVARGQVGGRSRPNFASWVLGGFGVSHCHFLLAGGRARLNVAAAGIAVAWIAMSVAAAGAREYYGVAAVASLGAES